MNAFATIFKNVFAIEGTSNNETRANQQSVEDAWQKWAGADEAKRASHGVDLRIGAVNQVLQALHDYSSGVADPIGGADSFFHVDDTAANRRSYESNPNYQVIRPTGDTYQPKLMVLWVQADK